MANLGVVPLIWKLSALSALSRLTFAAVLGQYFLISAVSKIGGSDLSVGPNVPGTFLSLGAFYELAPQALTAAGYNSENLSLALLLGVEVIVLAEVILPVLLVFGLATRIAAFGMIGLILLTTVIDIYARHAPPEVIGALFDARPYDTILDLRLLWITVLAIPAILGGGALSLDAFVRRILRKRPTH
jgi:putative oxidoreductase